MKSQIIVLLSVFNIVACVIIESNQISKSTNGYHKHAINRVYNQSKLHEMPDNHQPGYYGYERPCPDAQDIAPCVCTYDTEAHSLDLNCSAVESEEQLRQIFKADFPFKNFRLLNIQYNKLLKVLESYVFNDISFEEFTIYHNEIEMVEMHALSSSIETAKYVNFLENKITSFPFDKLSHFSSLKLFGISGNLLSTIPADTFHGITTLETLYLQHNTPNIVGTFQDLPNLKTIYLGQNNINVIPINFINTGSCNLQLIVLEYNSIVSVEPGSFDIVKGLKVNLKSNSLSTLEEAIWHPFLGGGVMLNAAQNPLVCGCDIAWLINNQLLEQVSNDTTCSDGEFIHNLDPSIFDLC